MKSEQHDLEKAPGNIWTYTLENKASTEIKEQLLNVFVKTCCYTYRNSREESHNIQLCNPEIGMNNGTLSIVFEQYDTQKEDNWHSINS